MEENKREKAVVTSSPCVSKCCLNDFDICLGCWRSLDEIKQWSSSDEITRQKILLNAQQRGRLTAND